jgi:hypothetical protein
MDVANASMYDGSTATPEAAMMAVRATGRSSVLVSRTVHPEYREVLRTYARNQGMPVDEFGYDAATGAIDLDDLASKITDDTAGCPDPIAEFLRCDRKCKSRLAELAHSKGALLVFLFAEAGVARDTSNRQGRRHRRRRIAIVRDLAQLRRDPTPASSRRRRSSCARCPAAWLAKPKIPAAIVPSA